MRCQINLCQAATCSLYLSSQGSGDFSLIKSLFTPFGDPAQGASKSGVTKNLPGVWGAPIHGQLFPPRSLTQLDLPQLSLGHIPTGIDLGALYELAAQLRTAGLGPEPRP